MVKRGIMPDAYFLFLFFNCFLKCWCQSSYWIFYIEMARIHLWIIKAEKSDLIGISFLKMFLSSLFGRDFKKSKGKMWVPELNLKVKVKRESLLKEE
jgi:hypothetical protein